MSVDDIKQLFPITTTITQEIIDEGLKNIHDVSLCIGAIALKNVLPKELHDNVKWGIKTGIIYITNNLTVWITTTDDIIMIGVRKPREITFIVKPTK